MTGHHAQASIFIFSVPNDHSTNRQLLAAGNIYLNIKGLHCKSTYSQLVAPSSERQELNYTTNKLIYYFRLTVSEKHKEKFFWQHPTLAP